METEHGTATQTERISGQSAIARSLRTIAIDPPAVHNVFYTPVLEQAVCVCMCS